MTRLRLGFAPSAKLRTEGDEEIIEQLRHCAAAEEEDEPTEMTPRPEAWVDREGRWDCETVISTLSNTENRPAVLDAAAPRRRAGLAAGGARLEAGLIRLGKTGVPVDFLPHARRAEAARALSPPPDEARSDGEGEGDGEGSAPRDWRADIRRKGETAEEKRARKAAVKEGRREARGAKKETRVLFVSEARATRPQQAAGGLPLGASVLPML